MVPTGVTDEDACRQLVEKAIKEIGGIDILVNNAGISMKGLFHETDTNVIKRLMEVNFWGTVYCTKYALPWLVKRKGSLVGISSTAGFHGLHYMMEPSRVNLQGMRIILNHLILWQRELLTA